MKVAAYSSSLGSQIASFQQHGFVVIRRAPMLRPEFITSVNSEVLNYFDNIEASYHYRFWRFCNSVSTPKMRHSIPLKLSADVRQLLNTNISHVLPLLNSQLSADAPMVNLYNILT